MIQFNKKIKIKVFKMRVLILSCNTGEGHNSCAKAIKEAFEADGHYCAIEDALAYISGFVSNVISFGHVFIYRHAPLLFKIGYRLMENHKGSYGKKSPVYKFLALGKKKLARFIERGEYDIVICTHVFAGVVLTEAKKISGRSFLSALVSTDYTCSPTAESGDLDFCIIPDESLRDEFTARGVKDEALVSGGIPIRSMFNEYIDGNGDDAHENNSRHLLVMSGSMGCGPVEKFVRYASELVTDAERITVVCGTNKRMYKKLSKKYTGRDNITIRGYVTDIAALMSDADLYFTKPGGISTTEAKAMRLPMLFADSVAGCEEYNCSFFVSRGCAFTSKNIKTLAVKSAELMRDREALFQMRDSFEKLCSRNSSEFIRDFLIEKASTR